MNRRIGIVAVDGNGKFPNVPLMKLSAYHRQRGDTVEWAAAIEHYDVVYMSKIFTFTPDDSTCYQADEIIRGGGYGAVAAGLRVTKGESEETE